MSILLELIVVLVVCPAALAMWVDARYPSLRPREIRRTTVHLGITGLVAFVALRPVLSGIFELISGPAGRATAMIVACTVITYCLTVSLWILRIATDAARAGR